MKSLIDLTGKVGLITGIANEKSTSTALHALAEFVDTYGVLPDLLNANNLMTRTDGTLVLSDPVFLA